MGNEGSHDKLGESLDNNIKVSWKQLSEGSSLSTRDGHCACSVGNKCFVFGGVVQTEDGRSEECNKMLVFDIGKVIAL